MFCRYTINKVNEKGVNFTIDYFVENDTGLNLVGTSRHRTAEVALKVANKFVKRFN